MDMKTLTMRTVKPLDNYSIASVDFNNYYGSRDIQYLIDAWDAINKAIQENDKNKRIVNLFNAIQSEMKKKKLLLK